MSPNNNRFLLMYVKSWTIIELKKKSIQSNQFLNYCALRASLYVRDAYYLREDATIKISSMAEFH